MAVGLGATFRISKNEWLVISTAAVLKTKAELLNISIEELANELWPEENERVKIIKDLAAAGVFATVIGSFAVWGPIFIPRFYRLLNH